MRRVIVAALGAAFLLAGCTPAQFAANIQEAGAAAKSYVDEQTDYREDLRAERREIERDIRDAYIEQARQAQAEGDLDRAVELYREALAVIDEQYPGLVALSAEVRRTVRALKGEAVEAEQ